MHHHNTYASTGQTSGDDYPAGGAVSFAFCLMMTGKASYGVRKKVYVGAGGQFGEILGIMCPRDLGFYGVISPGIHTQISLFM